MLKKIRIEDNGDSDFLPGTLVDILEFEDRNKELSEAGLTPASGEQIMLGIVVLVLESIILDKAMILGKSQIQLYVISKKYEEIRALLLDRLEAGVTLSLIETGRLEESLKGVLCVIPPRKLYDATEMIHSVDPTAFMTVTQIKEVRGRGFTERREYVLTRTDREEKGARL